MTAAALPPRARRTYRCHLAYSALSGVTAGVLTNAPVIGIKALRAADWHLALPMSLTGVGLLLSLLLGVGMARRSKMPFVVLPGLASCAACLGMAAAPRPFWFLFALGACNLFETVTRPAVTAIIRASYPVDTRGLVTGKLRQWSAGTFFVAALATARLLDRAGTWGVIQALMAGSAALQACAYLAFSRIRVGPEPDGDGAGQDLRETLRAATSALRRDSRFLRYLLGAFLFGASALSYEPVVRAYFSEDLGLNYTACVVLADVLPSVVQVLTVGRLGGWLDRTNPLRAWAAIRAAWGLDPLLLAVAPAWPSGALAVASAARTARGSVMGVSWVLSWQLGTNYFATRRELTSVYMGLFLSVVGVQRICGPHLGALLGAVVSRRAVLVIGGLLVLASALHAWRQAEAEKVGGRYPTFADQEAVDLAT